MAHLDSGQQLKLSRPVVAISASAVALVVAAGDILVITDYPATAVLANPWWANCSRSIGYTPDRTSINPLLRVSPPESSSGRASPTTPTGDGERL